MNNKFIKYSGFKNDVLFKLLLRDDKNHNSSFNVETFIENDLHIERDRIIILNQSQSQSNKN